MTIDNDWLDKYYAEVGREIGLASNMLHNTTNWSIGVTMGAVSAIALSGRPYPQTWTLGVVVVGFILVFRFFIRSCLAYANMDKWNHIHRMITKFRFGLDGKSKEKMEQEILDCVMRYHIKWESSRKPSKIVRSNLKLGYIYLFAILGYLVIHGIAQSTWRQDQWPTWFLASALIASLIYEFVIFPSRTYLKYTEPKDGPQSVPPAGENRST